MTARRRTSAAPRRGSDERGAAAVEFALVLPLLVSLLFVVITAGSLYIDQQNLQSVARDAARTASVDSSRACSAATANLAGNDVGSLSCQILDDCADGISRVQLTARQSISVPLIGSRDVTLTASSSFSCLP